jgi:hypothetical protein
MMIETFTLSFVEMIPRIVWAACGASLAIGLFFVLVWAPHPWGWEGFDNYYESGLLLARGGAFPTLDQPWGYPHFLAPFYWLFGDRPLIPLLAQTALNALMPLLIYLFARDEFDERVAVVSALLTSVLSFNTVYASTQAGDPLCNLIFMTAVLLFARARRRNDWRLYAAAGALIGIASQFRPNLILVPLLLAAFLVIERRDRARAAQAAVVVIAAIVTLLPWSIRSQRLAGEPLVTTTHGAMQLWYGTLQSGPYLKSRAHNPRSAFEAGSFPYTTVDRLPLVVTGRLAECAARPAPFAVVYWTDRDRQHRRVPAQWPGERDFQAELPPSPAPTTYYVDVEGASRSETSPYVYFVSTDHFGDLDRHDDLFDAFDVIRMMRTVAWGEPLPMRERVDFDGDGRVSDRDVVSGAFALITRARAAASRASDVREEVRANASAVSLSFEDGWLNVPRQWSGRITDVEAAGETAAALLHAAVSFEALRRGYVPTNTGVCVPIEAIAVNDVFYRREPQAMRRYLALAIDNIRRDPGAYLAGVAYRTLRVFFIEANDDPHTTYRFASSGRIYRTAQTVSMALLVLFAAGVWAARRRGAAIALPLLLIAYIPATLGFVLTNMRYSLTVQPLMFVFMAAALVSAAESRARRRDRARTETAPRL